MATRVQNLILGLGTSKQANISTPGSTFVRFKKLNTTITTPQLVTENDAAEIGKGNEFISQTFPSHVNVANSIEKFASSEFVSWTAAYALGNVVVTGSTAPYSYTITPIDPSTTLELPYFSVVEQISEGGGMAVDNLYTGCAINDWTYSFNSGPGRASSKMSVNWVGSGIYTSPSAITVPALTTEDNMLAGSMALSVNGVDYVANGRIVSGSIGWSNNLMLNAGFYPGSGLENGYQTRGRIEIGARAASFQFTVRAIHGSTEYTTLQNQTSGTATLTVSHDANNSLTFNFPEMLFQAVNNGDSDGLVTFNITGAPAYNSTSGILTVTTKCGIPAIAS
jgi:hypothetical protein